ncbi:MAG TPA: cell division topological specificity factor MinE [Anaerolineales bacterium]|nr:cell division topological specificity factor MinE [Anaerolineales bacterium]
MKWFDRLRGETRSARAAKERLQLVLVHDRADFPAAKLEALKDELIAVLSRHVEIDSRSVHITLTHDRDQQRLVADIPLASARARRRPIG